METIKVIDLLNKIANGEEVKARHRYFNIEYYNNNEFHIAYTTNYNNNEPLEFHDIIKLLNTEVEIIEEDKKIEKLVGEDKGTYIDYSTCDIVDKINEIIDYLNKENK